MSENKTPPYKPFRYFVGWAESILCTWTTPMAGEEEPPVKLERFATLFFLSAIARALYYAYRTGIRDAEKRRKASLARRWALRNKRQKP